MNKVIWTGYGFEELEKEFETAKELIEFMCVNLASSRM